MKRSDIKPGGTYGVRIKGTLTPVCIEAEHYHNREFLGWTGVVVATGEDIDLAPSTRFSRLNSVPVVNRDRRPAALRDAVEEARRLLGWDTMERRNSDCLDFHDVAVWDAVKLIEIGFEAGRKAAARHRR